MTDEMATTYRSPIAAAVYETVKGLYDIGLVDTQTIRDFEESCLPPASPLLPDKIAADRTK